MGIYWCCGIAFAIIIVVIWFFRKFASYRAALVFGVLFLGTDFGLILGLSASPLISAVLSGIFTLAGIAIPLLVARVQPPPVQGSIPISDPLITIAAIGPGVFIGLFLGIFFRVNGELMMVSPAKHENLRERYIAAGFNDTQVDRIMERLSAEIKMQSPSELPPWKSVTLLSQANHVDIKMAFRHSMEVAGTPAEQLESLKKSVSKTLRLWIETIEVEKNGSPDETLKEIGNRL